MRDIFGSRNMQTLIESAKLWSYLIVIRLKNINEKFFVCRKTKHELELAN